MTKSWSIVDLATMEKFGTGNTLLERLHDDPQSDLINKIAKGFVVFPPSPVAASRAAKARDCLVPNDAPPLLEDTLSPFNNIPTELVTMIFEQMESFIDAFMFGLTSSFVWECGEARIHQLYVRWFCPWGGQPLICLGGDLRDLPESRSADGPVAEITGALRAARIGRQVPGLNVKELEKGLSLESAFKSNDPSMRAKAEQHIEHIAYRLNKEAIPVAGIDWFSDEQIADASTILGARRWMQLMTDYERDRNLNEWFPWYHATMFPDEKRWPEDSDWNPLWPLDFEGDSDEIVILRNLSKKLYVRSDTLIVTGQDVFCGLGRALLSRISWSAECDASRTRCNFDINRGVWAGDCFDIIKLRDLDQGTGNWKDATSEVREEMISTWLQDDPLDRELW